MEADRGWLARLRGSVVAKAAALGALIILALSVGPAFSLYPAELAFLPFVDEDCADGPAQPITSSQLITALRDSGITARETDAHCLEEMVAEVTNVLFSGGPPDVDYDEVTEREGHVICQVLARPLGPVERRGVLEQEPLRRGPGVAFWLDNVDCAIYTRGDRGEAQVARLEQAFRELERSVG